MSEIVELEADEEIQQANLLVFLKNDNFDEFKLTLKSSTCAKAIDINHLYGDPENKTLLDIACSDTNKAPYVKLLLESGADVNLLNQFYGAAPIHLAVTNSDFDTVKLLVEHKDTDIHQPNNAGKTAFHLAAQCKRKDFIRLLQKRQAADIKLSKVEILTSIRTHYSADDETNQFIPPKISESYTDDENLFLLLHRRNFKAFASKANEENVKIQDSNFEFTYLQYACKLGLTEFVELLLNLNVDPNETSELHKRTPIAIAAFHGYHNIVKLLLDTGIITYDLVYGENILHSLMEGFNRFEKYGKKLKLDNSDYLKCLKLILDNVPDNLLNVDLRGPYGLTPLGYAIDCDNRDMILSLFERGAYIGAPGWLHRPTIQYMKPDTLKYFLNRSMTHNWIVSGSRCLVKFNYNFLTSRYRYSNYGKYTDETKPLLAISEVPQLRPLLKHPLFLVLLDFKWHIIMRKLYYTNLIFHFQFICFLSVYLLAFDYVALKNDRIVNSSYAVSCWYLILISTSVMFLGELTRLMVYSTANKCRYLTYITNCNRIALIVITSVILFCEIQSIQKKATLAAAAIFLSYVELILLILSHPRMCVRIEMFKSVSLNSFKFLTSYLILILAFAFSFYILFKDTNSMNKSFSNIWQAVFKTLLMSTGEYELSDVQINDEYGISRLVIVLFIFLIPTVLLNLLNAIAVSDIQSIKKDAELVSIIARIKLISYTEEIISGLFSFLDRLANHYEALVGRRQSQPTKCDRLPKRYYYTNYFVTTSNSRVIVYDSFDGRCTIDEHQGFGFQKFPISPFTQRSIREKLYATVSEDGKVDPCCTTADTTGEAATAQDSCKDLECLKDELKNFEKQLRTIELKLTENTKLLNEKLK